MKQVSEVISAFHYVRRNFREFSREASIVGACERVFDVVDKLVRNITQGCTVKLSYHCGELRDRPVHMPNAKTLSYTFIYTHVGYIECLIITFELPWRQNYLRLWHNPFLACARVIAVFCASLLRGLFCTST